MLKGMDGSTAVVTGASGGIGAAICRQLIEQGANVVAVDIDATALPALVAELGERAIGVPADVSSAADTDRFVAAALERFGSIDMFAANAGVECAIRTIVDFDPADFDRVYRVNVLGTFVGASAVTRQMLSQANRGRIVFTASMSALKGGAGVAVYVSSKHAVLGVARSLATEVGGTGIRVNTLCPGPVDTRMMGAIDEGRAAMLGLDTTSVRATSESSNLLGRYANAEEVATTAVWMLSDEAPFMHNEVITISGGNLR